MSFRELTPKRTIRPLFPSYKEPTIPRALHRLPRAYGAKIYVRVEMGHTTILHLLMIKTPLPWLELCGAPLLSKMAEASLPSMPRVTSKLHCWTDPTIVLAIVVSHTSVSLGNIRCQQGDEGHRAHRGSQLVYRLVLTYPFKSWWITRFNGIDPLGCNGHAINGLARAPTCRGAR